MSSTLSSGVSLDSPAPPREVPRRETIGAVLRVASGNFLEMYDFIVYGYYATYIGKTFFPAGSEFASLMLASTLWTKRGGKWVAVHHQESEYVQ